VESKARARDGTEVGPEEKRAKRSRGEAEMPSQGMRGNRKADPIRYGGSPYDKIRLRNSF